MISYLLAGLVSYAGTFAWSWEINEFKRNPQQLQQVRWLENRDQTHDWMVNFSVKFVGCYNVSQWNSKVEDSSDVRIITKRLARFRLCPSDACDPTNPKGCDSEYADFILDMSAFLYYYFPARQEYYQFHCGYLESYVCKCNGDMNCLTNCFAEYGMRNSCAQYATDDGVRASDFNANDYLLCREAGLENQYGRPLYIGPFCSSQGRQIRLGVFTDDSCSNFADSSKGAETYYSLTGSKLMYSDEGFVDADCMSCSDQGGDQQDGDGNEVSVLDACTSLYDMAGKCEANLAYNTVARKNNNACRFIRGVKVLRKDATSNTANPVGNHVASVFIGIFAALFALLAAYVYHLHTKIERFSIRSRANMF